jgi:hypothetical protein
LFELNTALEQPDIYKEPLWRDLGLNGESNMLLVRGIRNLSKREVVRFNRLLLEAAAPGIVVTSPRHLQTQVAIPGFKDLMIPLGIGYGAGRTGRAISSSPISRRPAS